MESLPQFANLAFRRLRRISSGTTLLNMKAHTLKNPLGFRARLLIALVICTMKGMDECVDR